MLNIGPNYIFEIGRGPDASLCTQTRFLCLFLDHFSLRYVLDCFVRYRIRTLVLVTSLILSYKCDELICDIINEIEISAF